MSAPTVPLRVTVSLDLVNQDTSPLSVVKHILTYVRPSDLDNVIEYCELLKLASIRQHLASRPVPDNVFVSGPEQCECCGESILPLCEHGIPVHSSHERFASPQSDQIILVQEPDGSFISLRDPRNIHMSPSGSHVVHIPVTGHSENRSDMFAQVPEQPKQQNKRNQRRRRNRRNQQGQGRVDQGQSQQQPQQRRRAPKQSQRRTRVLRQQIPIQGNPLDMSLDDFGRAMGYDMDDVQIRKQVRDEQFARTQDHLDKELNDYMSRRTVL